MSATNDLLIVLILVREIPRWFCLIGRGGWIVDQRNGSSNHGANADRLVESWTISLTLRCLCLTKVTLEAVGAFYLVSRGGTAPMQGE